jgi:hypothetical protein
MKLAYSVCLVASLGITLYGCGKSRAEERPATSNVERSDEVAITTRDGNVVLALTSANTVAMRLSDSLRKYVNEEVAREFANDSADSRFGRWIQRTTADLVAKGTALEFAVPVHEIKDVRYEDGEIRFDYTARRKLQFSSFNKDGRSPLNDFRPEDAERFVEAVRKAASGKS